MVQLLTWIWKAYTVPHVLLWNEKEDSLKKQIKQNTANINTAKAVQLKGFIMTQRFHWSSVDKNVDITYFT